jgi:hypothetical protein
MRQQIAQASRHYPSKSLLVFQINLEQLASLCR